MSRLIVPPLKSKIRENKIQIELRDICKSFGGNPANVGISFQVSSGEILGLVGENGAGKSTCMNMLFGHVEPDRGSILVDGKEVRFRSPKEAIKAGIGMVHQHFLLAPALTALEHLELVAGSDVHAYAIEAMHELGFDLDLKRRVEQLSVGQQQQLEILKVICQGARVIILDEPTAVLTPVEVGPFLQRLRRLQESGHAVILISHKLDEVLQVCSRIVVMRAGRVAGTFAGAGDVHGASVDSLASAMIGEAVSHDQGTVLRNEPGTSPVLDIVNLKRPDGAESLNVSLVVNQREIVGIAGVQGNGQELLFKAILRIVPRSRGESGTISVSGKELSGMSAEKIRSAVRIGVLPFDRRSEGLLLDGDSATNLLLSGVNPSSFRRIIPWNLLRLRAREFFAKYGILPANWTGHARLLSGGNQQKFLVAREMEQEPALILAAHPTRGVDWRSSRQIHDALLLARNRGAGVLLISSDIDELCRLSDRILVMLRGKIVSEFRRDIHRGFDVTGIGLAMVGGSKNAASGVVS